MRVDTKDEAAKRERDEELMGEEERLLDSDEVRQEREK